MQKTLFGVRTVLVLVAVMATVVAAALAAEPTAVTEPIDTEAIEPDFALLSGTVNPGGIQTSYKFQYGTTTQYNKETPTLPIGKGTTEVGVDASIDELTPATTYHYRIVAVYTPTKDYAAGFSFGADQTFTTLPAAAAPDALALTIANAQQVAVDKKRAATFNLACAGPENGTCAGTLELSAKVKLPGKGKKLRKLGKAVYVLDAKSTDTVSITLSKAVAKAIKKKKNRTLAATATTTTKKIAAPVATKVKLVAAK